MRVLEVLEQGIADGTHIGAQLYVSHAGEPVADLAVGYARDGVEMTTDSMMTWFSMTKAVTAVAVAQQWERGACDVDDPVVRFVPEFGAHGKERVTLRHLLTHTAGIPNADAIRDGTHCWVGMPVERYEAYGRRIGLMHVTASGEPMRLRGTDSARLAPEPMPGGNGRGPMNQLCRLYDMLLGHGARGDVRLLSPVTVAAIAARHRTGMLDETYGVVMDWGLGLVVDWYATGRYSSRRAVGHGGHQSSVAFCDPEHDLVVAVVCNGMPGRERHAARLDAISSAIYVDLGIASADDPGRRKPFPAAGL